MHRALRVSLVVVTGFASCIALFMYGCVTPSVNSLAAKFPQKKKDLTLIVSMADQDSSILEVQNSFFYEAGKNTGQHYLADTTLTDARWNEYRAIFNRSGISLGWIRPGQSKDIFVEVDAAGLLNRGNIVGYLHCGNGDKHDYKPCAAGAQSGRHAFNANPREEAYSFINLGGGWYAFDEGPS